MDNYKADIPGSGHTFRHEMNFSLEITPFIVDTNEECCIVAKEMTYINYLYIFQTFSRYFYEVDLIHAELCFI